MSATGSIERGLRRWARRGIALALACCASLGMAEDGARANDTAGDCRIGSYRLRDGSIVYVPEGETPKQPE